MKISTPRQSLMRSGCYASPITDFRCSIDEMEARTNCKVTRSVAIHWTAASKKSRFTVNIAHIVVTKSYLVWHSSYLGDR